MHTSGTLHILNTQPGSITSRRELGTIYRIHWFLDTNSWEGRASFIPGVAKIRRGVLKRETGRTVLIDSERSPGVETEVEDLLKQLGVFVDAATLLEE